jgi:hypothetical protein
MYAERVTLATFNVPPGSNATRKYTDLGPAAVARLRSYAARHGYGFVERLENPEAHPVCWEKFGTILTALDTSDWVVWVDSDVMPVDLNRPLDRLLEAGAEVITQCAVTFLHRLGWSDERCRRAMPFNSGIFAVRNTLAVRTMLSTAQAMRPDHALPDNLWDGLGDQEAIIASLKTCPVRLTEAPMLQAHPADAGNGAYFVHFYGNYAENLFEDASAAMIIDAYHAAMVGRPDLPPQAALYHWANIQNREADAPLSRGGPDRFLYRTSELITE